MNANRDGSRTATDALNRIADFERAILVICSIGTLCLVLMASGAAYAAWSFYSARQAISDQLSKASTDLHRTPVITQRR